MRRFCVAGIIMAAVVLGGCQSRSPNTGGYTGQGQPIGGRPTIAQQSRLVQGGSFGNR